MKSTLTHTVPPVRTAAIAEREQIIATLVLAFNTDPANRWLFPNPHQYLTYFPQFVQAFGGQAFECHTVYCSEDYSGAALWIPPGVELDVQPVVELIQHSVSEADQTDVFAVLEQIEHYHPQFPHWYLPFIGVEPAQQGRGYGSALLQPVLEKCDRDQIPAYLESSNPDNISFYERHEFIVLGTIQAGKSASIFPMFRQPR